ncbi:glycoside hydrolase family 3 N-terminal domain-containing protein [Consotaella salsifontis]|uniref:beta-N-acetylhexosaminidase n=1 Tax=Consotaella salsifontis TaxID=1365950 RepID=A0A1T4R4U4_9HYPH|nr:glycoside hydrolase family 3 protein [Consotaella salsifontis]SKA10897.1 beta-N-acetylhexosaminidase [Consotaella salsifontis]
MTQNKAWIAGCSGPRLASDEAAFFADERPWGFILFGRNVREAEELCDLSAALRAAVDRPDAPIFVDQEGGRVRRLRPPLVPDHPAPAVLGRLFALDREAGQRAAYLHGRILAIDLRRFGLNGDCVPCLDVPAPGSHQVIGDRAYGTTVEAVSALGRAAAEGLMAGAVLPVMKHMPGHGRGNADSHLDLPVVAASLEELEAVDFVPFKALNDLPCGMTAHLLFKALDPVRPTTVSPKVIGEVIRGAIGFDGLLMSDDLSMKALAGDIGDLAGAAIAAGCDVALHCNGDMSEMRKVASAVPVIAGKSLARAEKAQRVLAVSPAMDDEDTVRAEFNELTGRLAIA